MYALFKEFLTVYGKGMKLRLVMLVLGAILSGLMEIGGILLILPFISVTMDTNIIHTNKWLSLVYEKLGFTSDVSMIYLLATLTCMAFVVKNVYMLFYLKKQFDVIVYWKNNITEMLMKKYLDISYKYYLRKNSNEIINTLTVTIAYVLDFFVFQYLNMISYLVVGVCLGLLMFVQFFIPAVIACTILISFSMLQTKFIKAIVSSVNDRYLLAKEQNLSLVRQSIEAIKETKMHLKEGFYYNKFRQTNSVVTENDRMVIFIRYVPQFTLEIVLILCIISIICMVLYTGNGKEALIPSLGMLIAIAFRMAPVMNRVLTCYSQIKSSSKATKSLIEECYDLDKNEDKQAYKCDINTIAPIEFKTSMELKDVSFAYDEKDILKNISLSIRPGEFVGVVGASGAGKTTLIDILMGLLTPKSGDYLVDGKVVDSDLMIALRKQIGYVHQNIFISNASIRENIALGVDASDIDDDKVKYALKSVQLYDFFISKPEGLNTILGEGGKSLSGGQKQRVAIARALYHNPSIIVLDEATSALDVETEHEVTSAINSLKGEKTIIAIAHRLSTLKESDRIIYMENGEIADTGTFNDLSKNNKSFAKLIALSDVSGK